VRHHDRFVRASVAAVLGLLSRSMRKRCEVLI